MDYSIINQVYEEIIVIVNNYIKKSNCTYEVAHKLSFALLGYYLVFGPEIFRKLNILLDSIKIYEAQSKEDYRKKAIEVKKNIEHNKNPLQYNPVTIWDYRYDDNNKFIGGIPNVIYMKGSLIENVLSIAHEMSHSLEGISAKVEKEDKEHVYIKQGFTTIIVNKETNRFRTDGEGFIELVTSALETRILKSFLELDDKEIVSPLLKEFLYEIKNYKNKNVMANSYSLLNTYFKDLTDNDEFFNLIKEYFYENDEEAFKEKYESYDSRLKYGTLKAASEYLVTDANDILKVFNYGELVKKQVELFNKATHFEPDQKILILV